MTTQLDKIYQFFVGDRVKKAVNEDDWQNIKPLLEQIQAAEGPLDLSDFVNLLIDDILTTMLNNGTQKYICINKLADLYPEKVRERFFAGDQDNFFVKEIYKQLPFVQKEIRDQQVILNFRREVNLLSKQPKDERRYDYTLGFAKDHMDIIENITRLCGANYKKYFGDKDIIDKIFAGANSNEAKNLKNKIITNMDNLANQLNNALNF